MKKWYDEVEKYKFDNSKKKSGTGHFTQVVWSETTDLGCGIEIGPNNKIYAVSNYYPKGNSRKKYTENVFSII